MRMRIMTSAMEEMNEQGTKFTMNQLAMRLGMSKRTLYEHFESKEVLIEAIVDAVILDLKQQRQEIVDNDSLGVREKLIAMLSVRPKVFPHTEDRVKLDLKRQYPGLWKRAHESTEDQWNMIDDVLRDGINQGLFRPVFVPVLRKILQGSVNAIADADFLYSHRKSFQDMIGHIIDVVLYGIVMPSVETCLKVPKEEGHYA